MSNSLQQEMEFNTGSKNLKVKMLDKQFQQKNIIEKNVEIHFGNLLMTLMSSSE